MTKTPGGAHGACSLGPGYPVRSNYFQRAVNETQIRKGEYGRSTMSEKRLIGKSVLLGQVGLWGTDGLVFLAQRKEQLSPHWESLCP